MTIVCGSGLGVVEELWVVFVGYGVRVGVAVEEVCGVCGRVVVCSGCSDWVARP